MESTCDCILLILVTDNFGRTILKASTYCGTLCVFLSHPDSKHTVERRLRLHSQVYFLYFLQHIPSFPQFSGTEPHPYSESELFSPMYYLFSESSYSRSLTYHYVLISPVSCPSNFNSISSIFFSSSRRVKNLTVWTCLKKPDLRQKIKYQMCIPLTDC